MQIRSHGVTDRVYDPIPLDEDFPVFGGRNVISISDAPCFLHRHNALELGYCFEGHGVFIIGEEVYPFAPGDVSVIPAGVFHIAKSSEAGDSVWAFMSFDPYRFTALLTPKLELQKVAKMCDLKCPPLIRAGEHPEISTALTEAFRELREGDEFHTIAVGGLIALLTLRLHRIGASSSIPARRADCSAMERIAPALQHIAAQYSERVPLSELAEKCCMSEAQLRRLFHLAVGQSPQDYLTRFRLGMAMSMLDGTTLPILEIALRVGYASASSFNRHFRDEFGVSPRQWRSRATAA